MSKNLTTRAEDYSKWYNELVVKADLAENSGVRGCMVIKPYGYAIWEKMQAELDRMFKETGHQNAYFPLFIPKSYFSKEASHVDGFAKECAVVTHYRLKTGEDGKSIEVDPDAKLEEELIVRPTSETIIWDTYRKWIESYRDLPILVNQWANVVRWEMRTRLFLRTAEFLWQEGHTAHATKEEAIVEAEQMMNVYADFVENFMAIPVVKGFKTANERFAGAEETYCIEALMQDGKALQAGTSHFLGQNFAKAFDVKFANKEGKQDYVWATSWGVSTRLRKLGISVKYDDRDTQRPGFKFAEYELKGVPVRLAIGPKDFENGTYEVARRDTLSKEIVSKEGIVEYIQNLLKEIQTNLFQKALDYRNIHVTEVNSFDEFKEVLEGKGGFVSAHWDGTTETEEKIKELTKATIRCIPLDRIEEAGSCVFTGAPSKGRVYFAKAY
ncbi:MAG: proline--tRNA ligase [Flavobacteriaceae bacterium]|nr:proline--tRNA ligase [Flavobacteriaceae bacterium]